MLKKTIAKLFASFIVRQIESTYSKAAKIQKQTPSPEAVQLSSELQPPIETGETAQNLTQLSMADSKANILTDEE